VARHAVYFGKCNDSYSRVWLRIAVQIDKRYQQGGAGRLDHYIIAGRNHPPPGKSMPGATISPQEQLEQIEPEVEMQRAGECCEYLESHARRIYSLVVAAKRAAAAELGRHLKAGWRRKEAKFTLRDGYRACWTDLDTPERVRAAVDILVDAGWLRPDQRDRNLGRPSETISSTRAYTKSIKMTKVVNLDSAK
jgi:hypothetical protein